MATIKVKFRPSTVEGLEGTIYYQISHERKVRQILSDYHVFPAEWNKKRSILSNCQNEERRLHIISVRQHINQDMGRLTKIIHQLTDKGLNYTVDDIVDEYNRYLHEYSLTNFMTGIIARLKRNGNIRTSETYTAALSSFKKFMAEHAQSDSTTDIMLDSIDSTLMETYEAWQKKRGNSLNTISFYFRILRAVYNRAVEAEIIENRRPFRHVYTGIEKTVKRALPLRVIKHINDLDLSSAPKLDHARDMFIMSFMLRGMSFVDMVYLKKTNLSDGYITYRRRKTGQQLKIAWTKEMQSILNKYPENSTDYLLPIIRNTRINERYAYRNAGYNINRNLKKIAQQIGIKMPLTLYVARHSWASAAKFKGIPLSVISEGMGHDSETTTQIYLASLDTSVVDRANSLILKCL